MAATHFQDAKARVVSTLIIAMWLGNLLALEWPQEITVDQGTITIYQPQPESLSGDKLKARAAMSFQLRDASEPTFGAIWFTANVDTDPDSATAIVRDLVVSEVRWPDSKDAEEQRFPE